MLDHVTAIEKLNTLLPFTKIQITKVLHLLIEEDCTVPFVARYRKEATGNLDEVQIREIQDEYEGLMAKEKRRAYIIEAIEKMEQMTPELKQQLTAAKTLTELEDIYAPYKSKKKTKAMMAKEAGIGPLADMILEGTETLQEIETQFGEKFSNLGDKFKTFADALKGAEDILVEKFSHTPEIKDSIRQQTWSSSSIIASKRKGADEVKDAQKFRDFFEYNEKLTDIKDPKNTHRYLAMRRGMNLKILKVEIDAQDEFGIAAIESHFFPASKNLGCRDILQKCAKRSFDNFIHPSIDLEVKSELKKIADEAAIGVFGTNLKNLLLQPYLGAKRVMGIDPGVRTGCKVVIIDDSGKLVADDVIYPFEPRNDIQGSKVKIEQGLKHFDIKFIAIGNGTNGRETLDFLRAHVDQVKSGEVKAVMINEAGASIYSASPIAREEFPDKDVTVRGSVSIARRFQDPLAELVKIDPKSIGVGQYQHDVNQVRLKKSLEGVVESCVNFVGVDLNTASAPLLSYVSGIGPTLAKNVVKFREGNGKFKNRQQLLEVSRFSKKAFEQCAGFLRIYNGENPLDSTFVHPERYQSITKWLEKNNYAVENLFQESNTLNELKADQGLLEEIGELTLKDIIDSIKAPSQDPRTEFTPIEFNHKVTSIKDLQEGSWYTGVVNNITNFGAFVDIGIKESGLLHVSQISDEFVSNPLEKLKVGEKVKVKVIEIDLDRKRISLSRKEGAEAQRSAGTRPGKTAKNANRTQSRGPGQRSQGGRQAPPAKSAFAALKNFKVK